ncbi:hypothetical protein SDC9_190653 [bioreactor metagenome]|uniref:Uncharacterized protein n=1 Tax=bioreactor metagenome TaxID=1076179 RepID=A0A645I3V8_9ZZZZ
MSSSGRSNVLNLSDLRYRNKKEIDLLVELFGVVHHRRLHYKSQYVVCLAIDRLIVYPRHRRPLVAAALDFMKFL